MKKYLILSKSVYETKLALLEDNKLDEMYIERNNKKEITGNIYKGKVVDILNNGEIIFVDIGLEKNAFLSFENKKNISKYNIDDKLIVQAETEPRDEKGAKLTLDYSINGENLVLLPKSKNLSISKKIKDIEEVNRLKNIFLSTDNGLILRTNSEGKSEENLLEEYRRLENIDNQINKDFEKINVGLLYDVNSILKKVVALFDDSIEEFIIDDEHIFKEIKYLLEEIGKKDLIKKLRKYFKDEDIFEYYNINSQIERALDRKVYLDSGAYIIIEKTEALISIDVNTGQNTGNKTSQEIIFQTNLEATKEIARQIKLRNLAGIIIIDFIDMKKFSDRKRVLEEFKKYLSEDRVEINSVEYTNLGLIQFTRKRQGKELALYYREKCQYCEGIGYFLSKDRIILNLLEDLNNQIKSQDIKKIVIRTKKDIIKELNKYIDNNKIEYIEDNNFYKIGYKMELYN
ncbi:MULTISPECIES: Rne/Rng family ribonuclease [Fusobacterium]|uniref:Ribonuclease E/G n=1 Tax=Fusobacterium vincentii TaxID=155615 RepID=A0AAJ1CT40_FUSVC|nr:MULTISPECIES: ribonuclease E/G [Fusobacterium]ERT46505.1 ribonuclease G [Fusobacterium nucleatum CTI-7]MCW0263698.1 ribonuclease E/G [Fusobacterium vincentii]STO30263.1 Ribonuclease G [Fusobacterium vincentii]